MSSIDTFWLANALGERRAIAERHSTEVECLKKWSFYDKITINFHDLALKMLRKNVNIPLPSDSGCMCLHPKELSRLRLSNESAHSLIDTIGRAFLTLLGGNFELPLQICTRDNKRYVIKWIHFICKNVCYFSADDCKRRQLMFYTLIT